MYAVNRVELGANLLSNFSKLRLREPGRMKRNVFMELGRMERNELKELGRIEIDRTDGEK